MARTVKSKTSSDAPVESAPVVNAAAPVKAPKVVKKAKAPVESAPVESAPVVAADATSVEVDSLEASILEQSTEFNAKLQQLASLISSLKSEYKGLEKKWQRELKTAQKQSSKRKRKSGNRAPSGFVKPTLISAELASFLGKTAGTEMARTEVTREINAYIRDHQLQDKANGRIINADTKLSSLLKIPAGEELTYFNLQRYMSPHFTKSVVVTSA